MLSRGVQVHGDIASQSGSVFVGNPSFSANSINFNDRRDSDKYQCLRELYFTDSNVEKARLETREDILIETSYNWIFQDDSFQTWLSDEKSQILRITGEPGKGKTMAMIGIINNLAQRIPPKPSAIAFYFCRATDDKLSAFSGVIRGLLHHLLSQKSNEVLIRHLQAKFDKAGSGIFEGSTVGFALQDVLLDILQDAAFEAFYFIVDALDECKSGLNDLLKLIRTTTSKSRKIKWLVSSRNNLDVDRFFRCLDNATTINLEQHATEIGLGIQEYIENRVDILRRRHEYNTDQAKQITAALSSKAEGTFLWIHLACQSLDKTRRAKAVRSLEIMPSGLNAMYERMAQILQEINQDDEDRLLCQLILSAVTVAVRPLRVPELLAIINMASPDPEDIAMELTKLIARCGSFLSLQVVLYDFRSGAMIGKVVGSDVQTVRAAATSITLKLPVEAEDCVVKFADGRIAICSGTAGSLIVTHGDNPDLDTSAAILNKQVVHFSHGWFRMGRQAFIYTPPPYRPIRFYTSRSGIIAAEYPGGKIYTLKIDMEKLSKILDASM
ncbi:Vegetative incompatibility protein [Drechslerella dactyloides]|uniref:Vegetative incompatibility protein n=1 Tax=Drechslerella dactyloides TaxID=74499 RepID=A0AAD6IU61_DREDA|nr:Vegetative incompatibility protein [Drechslerella dactyloides]